VRLPYNYRVDEAAGSSYKGVILAAGGILCRHALQDDEILVACKRCSTALRKSD
jgi:hypothetical protein